MKGKPVPEKKKTVPGLKIKGKPTKPRKKKKVKNLAEHTRSLKDTIKY